MIIVWGERLYGKVNQVDSQVYVATKFFHIEFIPLIPLQSFIVVNGIESDGEFQGLAIAMSLKSVLTAYLRTLLLIGCIVFLFRAFMMFSAEQEGVATVIGMLNLMVGGFLALSFWGSYQLMKATKEEAKKLFQELRSVGIYL